MFGIRAHRLVLLLGLTALAAMSIRPGGAVSADAEDEPFRGVCVDVGWVPVSGATIHVVSGFTQQWGRVDPSRFGDVVSSGNGDFEIPASLDVVSLRVRITASGPVSSWSVETLTRDPVPWIRLVTAVDPIRVRGTPVLDANDAVGSVLLPSTGWLAGQVLRLDGTPARLGLRFQRILRSTGRVWAHVGEVTATTDETGEFGRVGLGEGVYEATSADAAFTLVPGYVRTNDYLRYIAATSAEAQTLHLDLELLDARTGEAITSGSARMYLTGYFPARDPTGLGLPLDLVAGQDVWRSREALPPGTWEVVLAAGDYVPVAIPGVRIPDGDRRPRLSLRLERRSRR